MQRSLVQEKQQSFLSVSASNIILSAFKRSQDQSGWIMRFYEAHGKMTQTDIKVSLTLLQINNIWECDLMENKNNVLSEHDLNSFKTIFQAYEIKTFFVQTCLHS